MISFTVNGAPVPQGSKVSRSDGSRTYMHESNRPALDRWRGHVSEQAAKAMGGQPPLQGAVRLDVVFVFPRPRSHYGTGRNAARLKPSAPIHCATRPDLDKLLRALGDSLTGIAIADDARIVEVVARKHYGSAAAHVELWEVGS